MNSQQVENNFQLVDTNKLLTTIPNADSLNHIVLFLTSPGVLPLEAAGCVYFSLPDPDAPPTWYYLGYLSNDKPSTIYKLSNITLSFLKGSNNPGNQPGFNYIQSPVNNVAQIGISVEPLALAQQMLPITEATPSKQDTFSEFAQTTVRNLINYSSSFSRTGSDIYTNLIQSAHQNANTNYVPLATLQTWQENYMRRLNNDPSFWKTLN